MFRAAFHTGYAPPNVMRLNKSHLDGACDDDRFPDDFYIDVIFEPADAEAATKAMQEGEEETTEEEHASVEAHGSKAAQALAGGGATGKWLLSEFDIRSSIIHDVNIDFLFCSSSVVVRCHAPSRLAFLGCDCEAQ